MPTINTTEHRIRVGQLDDPKIDFCLASWSKNKELKHISSMLQSTI